MEEDARDFPQEDHYCEHGTYVGSWAGPDFMCGWCEAGVGVDSAEWRAYVAEHGPASAEQVADLRAVMTACGVEQWRQDGLLVGLSRKQAGHMLGVWRVAAEEAVRKATEG